MDRVKEMTQISFPELCKAVLDIMVEQEGHEGPQMSAMIRWEQEEGIHSLDISGEHHQLFSTAVYHGICSNTADTPWYLFKHRL